MATPAAAAAVSPHDGPARRGAGEAAERARLAYLDALKVGFVAAIIAGHAIIGYATVGDWLYQDVQEATIAPALEVVLTIVLGPLGLFAMGLFFLMAGLLIPGSLARKGLRRFARDRLLRLGVPWAAFALLLWPLLTLAMFLATGAPASLWWWRFTHAEPLLDTGPLWFLVVLLLYSLGYAAWWELRSRHPWVPGSPGPPDGLVPSGGLRARRPRVPGRPGPPTGFAPPGGLRGRHVAMIAVGIAAASFLVRLRFPLDTGQVANLKPWQWPQFLAMFGLGIMSARRGWLQPVPDRLRRGCGLAAVAALLSILLLVVGAGMLGLETDFDLFYGGWRWQALAMAATEGVVAVAASLWLLGFAQRHAGLGAADRGPLARGLARSAYGAFVVQGPFLVALALALRPLALPAEVKALAVAAAAVTGSFALTWLLVTRTRLGRIL